MSEKYLKNLINSFIEGGISDEGLIELKNALHNSIDKRKAFDEYIDIWQSALKARQADDYDADKAWLNFKFKIKKSTARTIQPLSVIFIRRIQQIAAAIIMMVFLGSLVFFFLKNQNNTVKDIAISEYIIPYGSRSQAVLPDGSKVWLNAGSKLKYNSQFGHDNRNISLEGEAYFDVTKDNNLPFIVNTSELTIKVLGTAFNVKAYPDENFIETTVERGIVQVMGDVINTQNQNNIILKANQKLLYSKNSVLEEDSNIKNVNKATPESVINDETEATLHVDHVSTKKYTSWKDNRWIIEREELQSLTVKLERRYNVSIIISDENLKHYIFSGVLENETLEQVLEAIKLTAPIVYKIDQKQVILSRNTYYKPN